MRIAEFADLAQEGSITRGAFEAAPVAPHPLPEIGRREGVWKAVLQGIVVGIAADFEFVPQLRRRTLRIAGASVRGNRELSVRTNASIHARSRPSSSWYCRRAGNREIHRSGPRQPSAYQVDRAGSRSGPPPSQTGRRPAFFPSASDRRRSSAALHGASGADRSADRLPGPRRCRSREGRRCLNSLGERAAAHRREEPPRGTGNRRDRAQGLLPGGKRKSRTRRGYENGNCANS